MKKMARRSVSILLSLLMLVSVFSAGTITSSAASSGVTVYYDNTTTNWNSVGIYLYGTNTAGPVAMTRVTDNPNYSNLWEYTTTNAHDYVIFLQGTSWGSSQTAGGNATPLLNNSTTVYRADSNQNNATVSTSAYIPATTQPGEAPAAVLNGTNAMFYIGVVSSYTGNDLGVTGTQNQAATILASNTTVGGTSVKNLGYVNVPAEGTYRITDNDSWEGDFLLDPPIAGDCYILGADQTIHATKITDFSLSQTTIPAGTSSINLTATASATTSAIGSDQYIQYYIDNQLVYTSEKLTSITDTTTLDTSKYTAGRKITIQSCITDGRVYTPGPVQTLTVTEDGPAAPTGLTFTPGDNIVTGDGTSAASPLQYYSGKTAKITASASLPEGLAESETTYVEYAIGNQQGPQTEYVKDPSLVFNSTSGDNTIAATHRYLYARTVTDGETSGAVSVVFYTKCVNVTATISTIEKKDESTSEIGVAFVGIFPYTGYGSAVVTVKDGETQIAQKTYTQEELAAQASDGAFSAALTFPQITSAGEHPITAEITYEGVTAVSDQYVLPDPTIRTMEAVAYTEGEESTKGGTVQVSDASVLPGEEVTFTATANAEYQFKGWYSDAALTDLVSDQATCTLRAGEDNVKLYASFLKELYLRYHTGDDNITTVPMQWDQQNKYYYYDLTASQGTQYIYKITKTESSWENHNWNATPNAGGVECAIGTSGSGDFQITAAESGKLTIIFLTDDTGRYLLEGITYDIAFAKPNSLYVHAVVGNDTDKDGWSKVENISGRNYFFLPPTASDTQIEIFNTFGTDVTINGTSIAPGQKGTVSYTAGTPLAISGADGLTSVTVMRSNAEGALYINSTEYEDLIGYLSQSKELSAKGTAAIASGTTVINEDVKKIKGRGNTTWEQPKKPFNVTFSDAVTVDGLTDTKFSLLANYQDATLMRNRILYDLSNEVGMPYAPDSRFVDFYVNGIYQGSYQMSQKIELGEEHVVNLPDNAEGVTSDFNFILELDNLDNQTPDPEDVVISSEINRAILKGPDLSEDALISAGQLSFMQQKFRELENALYNGGTLEQLAAVVDLDSLAKAYLINELGRNIDGGLRSTYFTYSAQEDIFYAAPVWDFDCALGNLTSTAREGLQTADKTGWFTKNVKISGTSYINALAQAFNLSGTVDGKTYEDIVKNAWAKEFMPAINNIILNAGQATGENGRLMSIVSYDDNLSASAEMNYLKWPVPTYGNGFTWIPDARPEGYAETYEGMTAYMKNWLQTRATWMTDELASFVYSAPATVQVELNQEVYYADDSLVITALASGATYWLSTETQVSAESFDDLAGATYTYQFYDGDDLLHTTTGIVGSNVSYTILPNTFEPESEHNFYVRAFATPSEGAEGTTKDSDPVAKTAQSSVVWNNADAALEILKDSIAVEKTTEEVADEKIQRTNSVYANNGAYSVVASGVEATIRGADATVSYIYTLTPDSGAEQTLEDNTNYVPQAGNYTLSVEAEATDGIRTYRYTLPIKYLVNVQANALSGTDLKATLDDEPVDILAEGIYDLQNFPAEDDTKGNFTFTASASVTQPVPVPQDVVYSYTLKENNGQAAVITDEDADDSTLTFNIHDKCTAGNTYELTAVAQYESAGILQTSTKTYKFSVKNTGDLVTVFFGAPAATWDVDDVRLYTKEGDVYTPEVIDDVTDADGWVTKISPAGGEISVYGTGFAATSIATARPNNGVYNGTIVVYKAVLPAEQWFTIGNGNTDYEAPDQDSPAYFQAQEGGLYYVYGEPVNVTSQCNATTITDFKISAVAGAPVEETDQATAALNETITFKNVLSSRYASYQTPVKVEYYIGDHMVASTEDASSATVTADLLLTNTPNDPSDFDFVVGKSYKISAVVTDGHYRITYPNVVTIAVTTPQASVTSMTKSQVFSGDYLAVTVIGRNLTQGGYRVIENDGSVSYLNRFVNDTENEIRIANLRAGQSKIVQVYDGDNALVLTRIYSRGTFKTEMGTTTVDVNVAQTNSILWLEDRYQGYVGKTLTPYFQIYNAANPLQGTGWLPMERTNLEEDKGYLWYFDFTKYLKDNPDSALQGVTDLRVQFSKNSTGADASGVSVLSAPPSQNLRYGDNLTYTGGNPASVNGLVTIMDKAEVPAEIQVPLGAGVAATDYDIMRGESVQIYGIDRANSDNDDATAHMEYTLSYVKDGGETVNISDFTYDTDDNNKLVYTWTAPEGPNADGEYVFTITGKNSDGTPATDRMAVHVGEPSTTAPTDLSYIGDTTARHMETLNLVARASGGTNKLHFDFYMQYLDENGDLESEALVGTTDTTNSYQASITVTAPQQEVAVKNYKVRVVAYSIDPETPNDGSPGTKDNPLEIIQDITVTREDTHKIYFDPSWSGLDASNPFVNTDETVTLTTSTGRKVSMILDPEDENAERKYVFVGYVTEQELQGTMTFGGDTANGSTQAVVTESAPMHAGYIYTMSTIGNVWGSYNTNTAGSGSIDFDTDYRTYYPEDTDFTDPEYISTADQSKVKYLFFDNSVTKWKEVWLYTWGGFDTGTEQTVVQMQRLENTEGRDIYYLELPEGSLELWANANVPSANPDANTQGFMFVDRSGGMFGYQYMQSIDIKNWTGGIKNSDGEIIAENEFHFAEDFKNGHIIYPYFQASQYARINQADSAADTAYRYRAYIQMMTDYFYQNVQTKNVTFYVDAHTSTANAIVINRTSTDSGLYSYIPNSIEAYRTIDQSTVYSVTFAVPYTVDTETLQNEIIAKYAVTIDGVTYGATLDENGDIATGGIVPAATALDTSEVWIDLPSRVPALHISENRADIIAYRHSTTVYNVTTGGSLNSFSANIHYNDDVLVRSGIGNYSNGYYTLQYAFPDETIADPLNISVQAAATQTEEQKKAYRFEGWFRGQTLVQEPFDTLGNEQYTYVYTPVSTDRVNFTARFRVRTGADTYTSYFILTKDMLASKENPWTVEGLRWQAFNAAGVEDASVIGDGKPVDIEPVTMVNGISYDIDGYIFRVSYHSNIATIRFYEDGVDPATETKRATALLNVADGIRNNKVYYITSYNDYHSSIGIADSVHGWYNLKYVATFEYPVETERFYQDGDVLTHEQLQSVDTVVKPLEVYVSADLTKIFPRVDSRVNEYFWPAPTADQLKFRESNTVNIIPQKVETRQYSVTLVNAPEEAGGVEVSAGTLNSTPEIKNISSKPIEVEDETSIPYVQYTDPNKTSTQVEYLYGITVEAPRESTDASGETCTFFGWYDVHSRQMVSYREKFTTIITQDTVLMPVYSDNTTLHTQMPGASIDQVIYETYVENSVDKVKIVYSTRLINPMAQSNAKLYVQRAIIDGSQAPTEQDWSAPVDITASLNKDNRGNVLIRANIYDESGAVSTTRYYLRAYVEYKDEDGTIQKVYSNVEVGSPVNIPGILN